MANLVLGYQNAVLSGTVAASASQAGLGPDQLQNDQGNAATALQIPGTSGAITVTATGAFRAFGLFRTNLTAAAVVTVAVMSGGSQVYGGTMAAVVPTYRQAVLVALQAVSGTSVIVSISDPTNPDGFLNIPLAYIGPVLQPTRNFDYQSAPGRANQLTRSDTRSGGALLRPDWTKRTFDLSFALLEPGDALSIADMDFVARQGSNILLVPNPDAATIGRDALFGELMPTAPLGYANTAGQRRTYRATMTERL